LPTVGLNASTTRACSTCPGEEAWLVGERRASGERKYYLSNLPAQANLKTLAAAIKARWVCEQAHQQLKEELGLDHFEGRSWHGLHRHALMTMIAYAYLQRRRLAEASGGKKNPPRPSAPNSAGNPTRRLRHPRSRAALSMPALQTNAPKSSRINLPK
jgi:SRSO17 transposase